MIGLLLAACGSVDQAAPPPPPRPDPEPPPAPRLAVVIVVDQLPVRLLDAVLPDVTGGFARLAQGYVATARHRHLATETCPGHAALSTGASPRKTGIVGNGWMEEGTAVYCLTPEKDAGRLRADTLADRVTDAGGRAVSLSLKDRAAVMMGGHHPTVAAWLDLKAGGVGKGVGLDRLGALPEWKCAGERVWNVPAERAAGYVARFPDDQPFEADPAPSFPHRGPCDAPERFLLSPDAGRWLVDTAIGAVDRMGLGAGPTPDLLTISFSHVDAVGHTYTPDSWEALEVVHRLDDDLGRLFTHLDGAVGAGKWTVALSSDHGAPGAHRSLPTDVADAATRALQHDLGLAKEPVFGEPWLWLGQVTPDQRRDALAALRQQLAGTEGVLAVADPSDRSTWPAEDKLAEALALGVFPGRSGDLVVLRADGWQWERPGDKGTTHGSTDDLDQRVPLWFAEAGIRPGRAERDLDARQLAPTVAALLGVPIPGDAEVPLVRDALVRDALAR